MVTFAWDEAGRSLAWRAEAPTFPGASGFSPLLEVQGRNHFAQNDVVVRLKLVFRNPTTLF